MTADQDRIFEMIAKAFAGQLSASEQAELERWRTASSANERAYQSCVVAWQETHPGEPPPAFNTAQGWQNLQQRLGSTTKAAQPFSEKLTPARRPRYARRQMVFACAAILVLSVLGVFSAKFLARPAPLTWVQTAPGESTEITLDDGSIVTLNGNSRLGWRDLLQSEQRLVQLEGQAYFQVATASQPFWVETANARVEVLGTQFDVWARLAKTKVSVTEGRVAVTARDNRDRKELVANQRVVVAGAAVGPVQPLEASAGPAWLRQRLVFRADPLEEVLADLQSWFGTTIQIADPALATMQVTGSFQNPNLEMVLKEVTVALGLTYVQSDNGYLISR